LEKSVVIDVANDQLSGLAVVGVEGALIQLSQQVLLKRFLYGNGIEKELALILRFPRPLKAVRAGVGRLRHVIAPFFVQAGELFEFVLEIFVYGRLVFSLCVGAGFVRQFFENGICFHFLLNKVSQFEQGRLQDEQALLELRRENLL
jgi:hypothetical protein